MRSIPIVRWRKSRLAPAGQTGFPCFLNSMIAELLIRYLHFLGILTLAGALIGRAVLMKPEMERRSFASLVGSIRSMPSVSWWFWSRVESLVLGWQAIRFLSTQSALPPQDHPLPHHWDCLDLPTIFFNRERKGEDGEVVKLSRLLRTSVWVELILLAAMPLLATLMTRGIGLPS